MRAKLAIIAGLIMMAGVWMLWDLNRAPPPIQVTSVDAPHRIEALSPRPAPPTRFTTLAGEEKALAEFKGQVVLLHFWATWCPPCLKEFPDLLKLADEERERLALIAVSVDHDPEALTRFFSKLPDEARTRLEQDNVLIALDPDKEIAQGQYQTVFYPESLLLAPELTIRRKVAGAADWNDKVLRQLIEDLYEKNGRFLKSGQGTRSDENLKNQ